MIADKKFMRTLGFLSFVASSLDELICAATPAGWQNGGACERLGFRHDAGWQQLLYRNQAIHTLRPAPLPSMRRRWRKLCQRSKEPFDSRRRLKEKKLRS